MIQCSLEIQFDCVVVGVVVVNKCIWNLRFFFFFLLDTFMDLSGVLLAKNKKRQNQNEITKVANKNMLMEMK